MDYFDLRITQSAVSRWLFAQHKEYCGVEAIFLSCITSHLASNVKV